MVYAQAARKTGAFMLLAAILSLSIVTFLSGTFTPTAQVISGNDAATQSFGSGWILFVLGLFTGALLIGTYVYVAHLETKQEE